MRSWGKGLGALGDILISSRTSASLAEGPNPGEGKFPRAGYGRVSEKTSAHTDGQRSCPWCSKGTLRTRCVEGGVGSSQRGVDRLDAGLPHSPCRGPSPSSLPCRARHRWDQHEAGGPPGVSPMALALSYPLPTNGPECAGGRRGRWRDKGPGEEMRTQETGDSSLAG